VERLGGTNFSEGIHPKFMWRQEKGYKVVDIENTISGKNQNGFFKAKAVNYRNKWHIIYLEVGIGDSPSQVLLDKVITDAGIMRRSTGTEPVVFDEPKLKKEAKDLLLKASVLHYQAMSLQNQNNRNEILDKAGAICDEAIKKLGRIANYYEQHNIRAKTGCIWDWEKLFEEASQLAHDIKKAH
jgi:hypothetical protein